jgi:hypothetical protein
LVSAADSIYVIHDDRCLRLDAATGERLAQFDMPTQEQLRQQIRDPLTQRLLQSYAARLQEGQQLRWGHIRYEGIHLIVAAYPHMFDDRQPGREKNWNATSSEFLVVMDRYDGTIRWVQQARYGFRHNAIAAGAGKVFASTASRRKSSRSWTAAASSRTFSQRCCDGPGDGRSALDLPRRCVRHVPVVLGNARRAGPIRAPRTARGAARRAAGPAAGAAGRDGREALGGCRHPAPRTAGHARRAGAYRRQQRRRRRGPADRPTADAMPPDDRPTGPWNWVGAIRCGTQNFSRHLALFRSGAAAFAELDGWPTTANVPGVRPGCTNSLVVADGVFNVPDYSRTCSCSYQHQTSFGLVHMPEVEMWTYNAMPAPEPGGIRRWE